MAEITANQNDSQKTAPSETYSPSDTDKVIIEKWKKRFTSPSPTIFCIFFTILSRLTGG